MNLAKGAQSGPERFLVTGAEFWADSAQNLTQFWVKFVIEFSTDFNLIGLDSIY
jgi:hypothetical protein